jgi:gluconolactonase
MHRLFLFVMLAATLAAQGVGRIQRADPAFNAIAAPGAAIEKLAGGLVFTEGPVWIHAGGYLLFSDVPGNAIYKWTPGGKVSDFRKPVFPGQFPQGAFIGPNGQTLDKQGRLLTCEHAGRRIVRAEKNGALTTVVERYQGKRFNSPNDLVFRSNGDLYFTDPPYGLSKQDDDPAKEIKFNGVFRLTARGQLETVVENMTRPNGLAFSPDEKKFYVSNSDPARKVWMVFDVAGDGKLANGKVFFDVTANTADGLPDGMKVDTRGNLYCTGPGGVWVFSPQGKHLGTIAPPETPANCAWGDADGKTLYITARTGLYRVKLNIEGIRPRTSAAAEAIQLHVDLDVDPAKEQLLAANFRDVFRPAISRQKGFVDVKLLKLRTALAGRPPDGCTHRLVIRFQTEELRLQWVASPDHQKAWPAIEGTLRRAPSAVLLYDAM